jgi:hypothetical protein
VHHPQSQRHFTETPWWQGVIVRQHRAVARSTGKGNGREGRADLFPTALEIRYGTKGSLDGGTLLPLIDNVPRTKVAPPSRVPVTNPEALNLAEWNLPSRFRRILKGAPSGSRHPRRPAQAKQGWTRQFMTPRLPENSRDIFLDKFPENSLDASVFWCQVFHPRFRGGEIGTGARFTPPACRDGVPIRQI